MADGFVWMVGAVVIYAIVPCVLIGLLAMAADWGIRRWGWAPMFLQWAWERMKQKKRQKDIPG